MILLSSGGARADDRGKSIEAVRTTTPPTIDGKLDDPAWALAKPDARFTQNFPDEGRAPSQRTELRLLYDDRALYVAVRCHDTRPQEIVERLTRRDRDTAADKITVDIDSRHDGENAYHFDVNVAGVLADAVRFNDVDYNGDWDGLWAGAAARDDGGWSAELAIPWRTLRFTGEDPVLGLEVRRYLQRRGEVDEWAYVPRTVRGEVSRYGAVRGLRGVAPSRLFQLAPYLGMRMTQVTWSGAADAIGVSPSLGVDVKLGLTSSLTLDATVNPDFGQVEADQVVLDLTTFEVFYPEKRPFFLEGVDLFATPIQLFYTRRVGRAPPGASTYDGETILDESTAGRIWAAAKLSGQIAPHLSIAALDAVTAEQTALVQLPSGALERRLVDATANYAILRGRLDVGSSYLGVTGTAVDRFESGQVAPCPYFTPAGVPLSPIGGRCSHDAYAAAADARLASADGEWRATAQIAASVVDGGPPRPLADGTVVKSGDGGVGISANAGRAGGEHLLFNVAYTGFSPAFDINDAGYVRRANDHRVSPSVTWRWTRPSGPTLEGSLGAWAVGEWSWDGRARLWSEAGANVWMRLRSMWSFYFELSYKLDRWDNRETRDGALTQRPAGYGAWFSLQSDTRRRVSLGFDGWTGRVQHGQNWGGELRLALRPLPPVELDVIPRAETTWGDPRWTGLTDDLGVDASGAHRYRYWFGDLASQAVSVTLRGTYTFTPTLTLQLYAQLFVAGYHYDRFVTQVGAPGGQLALAGFQPARPLDLSYDGREGALNLNAVLRWEYRPGSTVIAVYTRSQAQVAYDPAANVPGAPSLAPFYHGPATDVFLLKLSYLWS